MIASEMITLDVAMMVAPCDKPSTIYRQHDGSSCLHMQTWDCYNKSDCTTQSENFILQFLLLWITFGVKVLILSTHNVLYMQVALDFMWCMHCSCCGWQKVHFGLQQCYSISGGSSAKVLLISVEKISPFK